MLVQNGATLQYQGLWFGNGASGDSIVGAVAADLAKQGLSVAASANNGGMSTDSTTAFGVSITLKVNNGTGFHSEDDAAILVHHWVQQETGKLPELDAILFVNNPNTSTDGDGNQQPGGTDMPTGASPIPGAPGTPQPGTGGQSTTGTGKGWLNLDWLKNLFNFNLPSLDPLIIVLLGIGLLIAVIFITTPRRI